MTTTSPDDNTPGTGKRIRQRGDGTVFQRKDGRWTAQCYVLGPDHTRSRLTVYGRTRTEAADKLTAAKATSNRGLPVLHAQGTVAAYVASWLDTVAAHRLRPTTHTRYQAVHRLYIHPDLGTKKLTKLTTKDVRTWLDHLRTRCQCCHRRTDHTRPQDDRRCCAVGHCCNRRLNPLTLTYIHSVLKTALEHAVREEEIPRNVARNVRLGTPRPRRFEPLTADEARTLLTTTAEHPLHPVVHTALHTGLRRGELLALRWNDLDLTTGTAVIRRTLQRTNTGLITLPTKTNHSDRRIPLPTATTTVLRQHQAHQQTEQQAAGHTWNTTGYLFTQPGTPQPIEPTTLNRRFATLLHHTGLRRIRFHDLRHTTATLLLDQGVELIVIKELLGHAHIGVTATVYAHVRLGLQRDAINTLSTTLNPTPSEPTHEHETDDPPENGIMNP